MELFSLLAKLTLDKSEYEKGIEQAKSSARIDLPDPSLGIDTSEFDAGISDANDTNVEIDDPELGLDKSEFDTNVEEAEGTEVSDPDDPELGLDTSEFSDGISEAESLGSGFGDTMKGIFSEIKGALAAAGITAALAGVTNFLKEGIELAKNNGDAIDKQSQKLNLSTKAYQELDYALTLSGASIGDLTRAMRTFTEIQGGKATDDQVAAFEKLGISATDASGKMKSAQQLMEESMYALADYGGEDRGLLTEALFGRNSAGLNALLNSGSAAIKEMRQEANDLGLVMTDEEIKNAAAYMDATTRLEKAVVGIKEEFASGLIPLLTDAANLTARIVAFFNGRTGKKSLAEEWAGDDKEFAEELMTIEGTAAAAETLADKLLAMGSTSQMTAEQYAIWKGTADELIKLVPTLGNVIDTESGKISANSTRIKENIEQWEKLAKQKALQELKEKRYQALVEKNSALIDKTIAANRKEADAEGERAKMREKLNQFIKDNELEETVGLAGENSTAQELNDIFTNLRLVDAENGTWQQKINELVGGYASAQVEAARAKEEADKLAEELEKDKQDYDEWVAAAEQLYGITASDADSATEATKGLNDALNKLPDQKRISILVEYEEAHAFPQAKGNDYVPYDNYPSLLHRGEMVLTASEANRYRSGSGGGSADLSGLEDRIISAIKSGMENATVRSYLNGRDITDDVNRRNMEGIKGRRFST